MNPPKPLTSGLCIRVFRAEDEAAIIELWDACGLVRPQNDPRKDIARKMRVTPELFLVAERGGKVIGSCMAGYEGHRGWINYLAVSPNVQRQGVARQLMSQAEDLLRARGCPKINLQVRTDNTEVIAFYKSIGFAQDPVLSFGKRLEKDDG